MSQDPMSNVFAEALQAKVEQQAEVEQKKNYVPGDYEEITYCAFDTKEKAIEIYNKLFSGAKPHLSPTEHQAKAMFKPIAQADVDFSPRNWERGVTALTSKYDYKSGNFNGWIQYRQLI